MVRSKFAYTASPLADYMSNNSIVDLELYIQFDVIDVVSLGLSNSLKDPEESLDGYAC